MYKHLGPYSDLVDAVRQVRKLYPLARPGVNTRSRVREVLGFSHNDDQPIDARIDGSWESDGVKGEEVSWSVGYGPRTQAWLLRPSAPAASPMPAVIALHDHGNFKDYGKEKIAEGPSAPDRSVMEHRAKSYGGRAYPNELARRGYVVLVHDTFLWGSRAFPYETIPEFFRLTGELTEDLISAAESRRVSRYDAAAVHHEHVVEKYCSVLGTTLAGLVCYEDRVALNYLLSRTETDSTRVASIGLSGGGNRTALLTATHDALSAAAIIALMSTYSGLYNEHVASHTWMLYPAGWARYGDWPDVAASRAPMPLLVQYNLDDELFDQAGMQDAHERIKDHYSWSGETDRYTGEFFSGPHKFDLEMQASAFAWLDQQLQRF